MSELSPPAAVALRLLDWYADSGRDLPWRRTRDPYCIWLSEIMLQQTTVEAVIPYYQRFLGNFATVEALASASLDAVLDLWAGLGYYSRARNLHKAARQLVEDYGGTFPADLQGLQSLPGVGRSTAGAILSIAFDLPGPILDGNVRRVLCRLYGVTADPRAAATEKRLWRWAEDLTPAERPHDYAQAIMDLGATVCTPRQPRCEHCPLATCCVARRDGVQHEIPAKRRKAPVPKRTQVALLAADRQGALLVRKRPYEGMLGGLWEFPAAPVDDGHSVDEVLATLRNDLGLNGAPEFIGEIKHLYSHFELTSAVFLCRSVAQPCVGEGEERQWLLPAALAGLALHGAHKKVLTLLVDELKKG